MTCELPANFIAAVQKTDFRPGDILHVSVGVPAQDMGGSHGWFPSDHELHFVKQLVQDVVPDGVRLLVTGLEVQLHKLEGMTDEELERAVAGTD